MPRGANTKLITFKTKVFSRETRKRDRESHRCAGGPGSPHAQHKKKKSTRGSRRPRTFAQQFGSIPNLGAPGEELMSGTTNSL